MRFVRWCGLHPSMEAREKGQNPCKQCWRNNPLINEHNEITSKRIINLINHGFIIASNDLPIAEVRSTREYPYKLFIKANTWGG